MKKLLYLVVLLLYSFTPPSCSKNQLAVFISKSSPDSISARFKNYRNTNNDDCVLTMVEIVSDNYINSKSERNFQVLNKLSCSFDGYISEFFIDYTPKLTDRNYSLLKQLYRLQQAKNQGKCLEDWIELYIQAYDADGAFVKFIKVAKSHTKNKGFELYLNKLIASK